MSIFALVAFVAWREGLFAVMGTLFLIAVVALVSGITERKSRVGKTKILASAICFLDILFMAVAALIPTPPDQTLRSPPRQQWQAATAPVGPAIDRVSIEGRQATIWGEATTDSQITIAVGGGYERSGFRKNGPFTATVKAGIWGLDIVVLDAEGDVLLAPMTRDSVAMQSQRGQIAFHTSPQHPKRTAHSSLPSIDLRPGRLCRSRCGWKR